MHKGVPENWYSLGDLTGGETCIHDVNIRVFSKVFTVITVISQTSNSVPQQVD